MHSGKWAIAAAIALAGPICASAQELNLTKGPTGKAEYRNLMAGGPRQPFHPLAPGTASAVTGLPFFTPTYTAFGHSIPLYIVGTDPSLGSATTTIPVVIVPIKLIFAGTGNQVLDGTNVSVATAGSPLFQVSDYKSGSVDVGITQYADAIQRGQFWKLPGFSQAGYHVLLGTPTIASTVTITVPAAKGAVYILSGGGPVGVIDDVFFDTQLNNLISTGQYTPNEMVIFLTDNVFEAPDADLGNCCALGYHQSQSLPLATAQTWIYFGYTRPGTFVNDSVLDVQPLSHEIVEWINDPFVGAPLQSGVNLIPPAVLPGTGGACIFNLELADPFESPPVVFTQKVSGTTYHLQEESYIWWYLHGPSYGANGYYSFLGKFLTPSTLCGAG
jgi:hypothetical protein